MQSELEIEMQLLRLDHLLAVYLISMLTYDIVQMTRNKTSVMLYLPPMVLCEPLKAGYRAVNYQ